MKGGSVVKWSAVWKAALICAVFAVSLVLPMMLAHNIPGYSSLSSSVRLAIPLVIALLVSLGIGRTFVKLKHVTLIVSVCALVSLPFLMMRGDGTSPFPDLPNFHVPEGYMAFRFTSSFTYVGSESGGPITDVELELPWPYIDDYGELGRPEAKPIGLDRWLRKGELVILVDNDAMDRWLKDVWKLENVEPTAVIENFGAEYRLDNTIWYLENSVNYCEVDMENITLRLFHDDKLVWADGVSVELYGDRTAPPRVVAELRRMESASVFQKITIEVSEMYPGETVNIAGVFLVREENASKVRIDDWVEAGKWRTFKPNQENAPVIVISYYPETLKIDSRGHASLERYTNGVFSLVVRYDERWSNLYSASGFGLIDGTIIKG